MNVADDQMHTCEVKGKPETSWRAAVRRLPPHSMMAGICDRASFPFQDLGQAGWVWIQISECKQCKLAVQLLRGR